VQGARGRQPIKFLLAILIGAIWLCCLPTTALGLPGQFFGLDISHEAFDSDEDWLAIQKTGAAMVHMQFDWAQVESSGGWANSYDKYVEKAALHGEDVLPYLYGRQVNDANHNRYYTSPGWNAYEEAFVAEAVKRYGYSGSFWTGNANSCFHPGNLCYRPLTVWEVWNEPNLEGNNPGGVVNGASYAAFLKKTDETIVQAQKTTGATQTPIVLFGGIYQPGKYSLSLFLKEAKESGVGVNAYYDGLSIHPYGIGSGATSEATRESTLQNYVNGAREYLNKYCESCGNKTLWVTEFGWGVGSSTDEVTELEQSNLLWTSYAWLEGASATDKIQYAAWYLYRDPSCCGGWDHHAGLRNEAGLPRTSWCAYHNVTGAPCQPYWHGPGQLGGLEVTANPDVASAYPGQLDLYARGPDGALWQRLWSGTGWSEWASLGGSLKAASGPGAMSKTYHTVDVFARTPEDKLVNWYFDGTKWNGPGYTVEGTITSDPDLAAATSGQLDVFARSTKGTLIHKHWSGSSWSAWEDLGGALKEGSGPAAVSKEPGTIDVFGRAPNDSMVNWYFDGTKWNGPGYTVGGVLTSDPDVATPAVGQLDVYIRGTDGALWHRWWSGSSWGNWESLGGFIKEGAGPTAVSKGTGEVDVFAQAPNNSLLHWYFGM
jgi:hypothetical protein